MSRRLPLLLLVLCLLPALALAAGRRKRPAPAPQPQAVEALGPERVGLGEPFVMRVRSRQPMPGLAATWLERRVALSARKQHGVWEAVVILGSDVAATRPGRHELLLRHGRPGRAGGVTTIRSVVELVPVERPVERLELDEAFVTPPKEAHARILAERKLVQKLLLDTLARPVADGADTRLWELPLARPVPGETSSPYGIGRILNGQPHAPHRGLDMEAPEGQPVVAAAAGVVLYSGELYYGGNSVYVDHGQGLATSYLHLSERHVRAGERVARGQRLGLAGSTGRSTRSHLHFGVWALGRHVDPEPLFLYDPLP